MRRRSRRITSIALTMRSMRIASGARWSRPTGSSSGSAQLPRQSQPGAFLLGQLRSRGDAFLRPARAASSGRRAGASRRGDARGLFARSQQRGLLAGRPRIRGRVLFLRLSRTGRLPRQRRSVRAPRSSTRTCANSSCPMTPCGRRAIRIGCCSTFSTRPTKRRRLRKMGPRASRMPRRAPAHSPARRLSLYRRWRK